jgi:hypothetical protein
MVYTLHSEARSTCGLQLAQEAFLCWPPQDMPHFENTTPSGAFRMITRSAWFANSVASWSPSISALKALPLYIFSFGTPISINLSLCTVEYSYSHANAIAISGTDIYVAGYVEVGSSASVQAVYWKNGVRVNLNPPGIDTLITDTYASGIALSGTDVHIIGWQDNTQAIYWKNGVMTYLNNTGTYENMTNNMNSIAVLDTNVYISLNTADYWKNGKIINVGSGYATSIFVQPK